jgi:hypothetical protein
MGERKLGRGQTRTLDDGRLTRRTLLSGAAAAGAASLVVPGTGLAAAALRRSSVFSRAVGSLVGQSPPIPAGREFALVGIQWSGPASARIALRAQAPGGGWTPWVTASVRGHDGDGHEAHNEQFGEPVWTGPALRVQLRTDHPVSGLRVHFVSASATNRAGTAAALPLAAPVLPAGPGQPPILARAAWARGRAQPTRRPHYGQVKLAFVHHTVNANGYSPGQVTALLRGIFDYHVHVRGYWDIAYNFIIDRYGRIWEARAGGIDMPVTGAHAGAYNTESTGVAMLGDFMNAVPPPAAIHALERLLAWKLSLHGLPSTGRANVVVDPADAFYTPFRPGAHILLPRVAGHRDGDLTDCPGNALYARLASIRRRVSALAGDPARLTAGPSPLLISAGASGELAGTLALLSGQPLAAAPLEIQSLGATGPPATTIATPSTASDGSWSQAVSFTNNTLVRALHRAFPASVSDWVEVVVAPVITLSAESTSPLTLTGTVSPAKPHVTLSLYPAGTTSGKPLRRKRTKAATGTFTTQLSVPGPGDYVVVARTAADGANAAGVSAPVTVTVS